MSSKLRSVVDIDSEEDLRRALMNVQLETGEGADNNNKNNGGDGEENPARRGADTSAQENGDKKNGEGISDNLDWVLPKHDPETTEPQSMREELLRLQALKNYLILDADREDAFERLTGLAARFYRVPIALISLVDLGRQWFLSNRGLGVVRETPRKHAFCAHAILNKHNILIVPDATQDFRFKDNPLVTGPPNIRFYAGAVCGSPSEGPYVSVFVMLFSLFFYVSLCRSRLSCRLKVTN